MNSLIDSHLLYPEVLAFPEVRGTPRLITTAFKLEPHHCNGHFRHRPMLPLSEIGAMCSRLAALHCQLNASQDLDFWLKDPVAVVAKYTPSELVYLDPAAEKSVNIRIVSRMEKYSTRVSTVNVHLNGVDKTGQVQVDQSFLFKMVFRMDLAGWQWPTIDKLIERQYSGE